MTNLAILLALPVATGILLADVLLSPWWER